MVERAYAGSLLVLAEALDRRDPCRRADRSPAGLVSEQPGDRGRQRLGPARGDQHPVDTVV